MRSVKEQVDQFIEGLADGSIILLTSKLFTSSSIKIQNDMGLNAEHTKGLHDLKNSLIEQLIPNYMKAKGKQKGILANGIFKLLLLGRAIGLIYNDENLPKELNWYRIQNDRLNRENEKLRTNVKDLTKTIMEFTGVKKDQKVGIK